MVPNLVQYFLGHERRAWERNFTLAQTTAEARAV
jgi:hypothetical protein